MGERAAAKYLRKELSMDILARNFRAGRGEIDIVARDGNCLVFVEVKTRMENAQVDGYFSAVSPRKMRVLRRTSLAYLSFLRRRPPSWRIDVVEVRHGEDGKVKSISHFPNVG